MFNGKRVEVLNTDAEGRMILGDAIARACEDGTDYLFETSTLTGGQVIALGKRIAGVMGTPELCERVQAAGDAVGEPAWPMPLPDDVRKGMDSDVADISQVNAGMDRAGHMLQGGVFLREFVADGVAWAHIDIAGPALPLGRADRLLDQGRHRRAGPHPAAARRGRRRQRLTDVASRGPLASPRGPFRASSVPLGAALAALVVVAHPLRVAHQPDVVDRDAHPVREAPGAVRAVDAPAGPLAVVRRSGSPWSR